MRSCSTSYRWSSGLEIYRLSIDLLALLMLSAIGRLVADDWVMRGRDETRNAVSTEVDPPTDWDPGRFNRRTGERTDKGQNIGWIAELGTGNNASPVISDGLVWIGSNRSIA